MGHPEALMQAMVAVMLATVRLGVFFTIYPLLHSKVMSAPVKIASVLSMGCVVYPLVYAQLPASVPWSLAMTIVVKEALIGALMGYCAGIVFWAAEGIGNIIDQQTGANMAAVMDPMTGHPEGPSTVFIQQVMATLVMTSNAFLLVLGAAFETYKLWPVFSYWPKMSSGRVESLVTAEWNSLTGYTLRFAGPVMLALLLVELGLGLIQRYASTLDVFFLSQPIKQLMAVFMLTIMLGMMADTLVSFLGASGGLGLLTKAMPPTGN